MKSSFIMNTTQILEQSKIVLGEIVKEEQEPCSSPKCKVEVRYFKKPHQYTVVKPKKVEKKPKKVEKKITPEMTRERNRNSQRRCRYRKRILKEMNNPKPKPLTAAQLSKRYRDKKKNQKKI